MFWLLHGVPHYDAANVLVTASRPRLGKRLLRVCTASYSETPVVYLWFGLGRHCWLRGIFMCS